MKRLLIIDGNSIACKYYYGCQNSRHGLVVNDDSISITISTSFPQAIINLVKEYSATHLVVCFDYGGQTFRHKLYPQYKANREKPEDLFKIDLRNCKIILEELGIKTISIPYIEADDLIASLCNKLANDELDLMQDLGAEYDLQIIIVSNDKDLLQLVDNNLNIQQLYSLKGNNQLYDEQQVYQELGIKPWQISDYKALVGDKSDNIPGVNGIGKIKALHLLSDDQFNSVSRIYENYLEIKNKFIREKIADNLQNLTLFNKLTNLQSNLVLTYELLDFLIDIKPLSSSESLNELKYIPA